MQYCTEWSGVFSLLHTALWPSVDAACGVIFGRVFKSKLRDPPQFCSQRFQGPRFLFPQKTFTDEQQRMSLRQNLQRESWGTMRESTMNKKSMQTIGGSGERSVWTMCFCILVRSLRWRPEWCLSGWATRLESNVPQDDANNCRMLPIGHGRVKCKAKATVAHCGTREKTGGQAAGLAGRTLRGAAACQVPGEAFTQEILPSVSFVLWFQCSPNC